MLSKLSRQGRAVETLESRLMLSAAVARVSNGLTKSQLFGLYSAGQTELHHAASSSDAKLGVLGIASSQLRNLYSLHPTGVGIDPSEMGAIESVNGIPAVSVQTTGSVSTLLSSLEKLGLSVMTVNQSAHTVDGYLPLSSLVLAAKLPHVNSISAIQKAIVNSVGKAVDQGESVENVSTARNNFGVTGAGVKIGVISDSASQFEGGLSDSVSSGDLPGNVTILSDGNPGDTDEGRAMMEEIHDMAPGASLYFYSGDPDQDAMVRAVNALKAAGCKIIVDDLGYSDEPMFQDGVISKAINSFVAGGGTYFSAIGNDGTSGYLHTKTTYTNTGGADWVNWANNGATSGETLQFTTSGSVDITLQWDNPYNGDTGSATADLDVYVYHNGTLVTEGTDDNLSSGIPQEYLDTLDPGTYQMKVKVAALSPGAQPPDMIRFVASEEGDGGLSAVQYTNATGIRDSGFGHGAGQNTISVGAVEFASAPPFSSATPIKNETYSSAGPIIYAFDANGNKLSTPLTLDKPDISGVDGINTSFFGEVMSDDPTTLPQFYGTSAAAPNVAAIAALIEQGHPSVTQAQILAALVSSATPLNGAAAGNWDPQGGYGLVDANKALAYFGAASVAPTVSLAAITSPRATALTTETITFDKAVSGFSLSNLSLTLNGGPNLLTSAQTLASTDQTTFTLGNLAGLTATAGTYKLTLSPAGITGAGLPLAAGTSVTWVNNSAVTATVILAPVASPRTTTVPSEMITFSAAVTGFKLSNLSLTRNGGANLLTSAQTLTSTDSKTYLLNNLATLTAAVGTYTLTLSPTGITGNGLKLAAGGTVSWQMNGSSEPPFATLTAVSTPRSTALDSEDITFNEPVTGLTLANFSLSNNLKGNLITTAQTLTTTDNVHFTLGNLSSVTSVAGSYVLSVSPTGVSGTGGNMSSGSSISWALNNTIPIAPTAVFAAISTPRQGSVSSETITFNEPVTGFSAASLSLTLNGGANLLTGAQTLTSTDQTVFTLTNLDGITAANGTYKLSIDNTGITGSGVAMSAAPSITWAVAPPGTAPTVSLAAITSPRTTAVSSETISFNEAVSGFTLADLTLTRNGGANLLSSSQTLSSSDQKTFTLGSLSALTSQPGNYVLTIGATGIVGDGIALASGASASWTNNNSGTVVTTVAASIANATITKPASGTAPMVFTVTLSAASTSAVVIQYATVGGTASSGGNDYVGITSATLTIPAGKTTGTITVTVKGNTAKNAARTFSVHLISATNATITNNYATGTILSSTVATTPTVILPATSSFVASKTATTVLSIPVTLTQATNVNVTITYATLAGTASSGGHDYVGVTTATLTILAGQTTGHINITVMPHASTASKYFYLTLSKATNAKLATTSDKITLT